MIRKPIKIHADDIRVVALSGGARLDADESASFARALEHVNQTVYEVRYPELQSLSLVPVNGAVDPGADFYTWSMMDKFGQAQRIVNLGDDFPRINVQAGQVTTRIETYGGSYEYSIMDLRRQALAEKMGLGFINLDTARPKVTREAIARKIDYVVAFGDSDIGVPGFLNNSLVPTPSVLHGTWQTRITADSTAGPALVLDDMLYFDRYSFINTKQIEAATTMVLPTSLHGIVSSVAISPLRPDVTILEAFLKNAQHIKEVVPWYYLELANAGGTGPRVVTYKRDPTRLEAVLPIEFEALPPQARNAAFVVNCMGKCGGTIIRYPYSAAYWDGCGS